MMDSEMRAAGRDFLVWFRSSPEQVSANNPFTARLGFNVVEIDPDAGFARVHYMADAQTVNFLGLVHGGVLGTILDETGGMAAMSQVGAGFRGTVNMNITYISPARPGLLVGEARVVGHTKTLIFVESSVCSEAGQVHARGALTMGFGPVKR